MRKDGSMDIDTCAAMSEKISEKLDEVDMIASEYFLEVCSPGAERELKDETQIRDALDEYVYVKLDVYKRQFVQNLWMRLQNRGLRLIGVIKKI